MQNACPAVVAAMGGITYIGTTATLNELPVEENDDYAAAPVHGGMDAPRKDTYSLTTETPFKTRGVIPSDTSARTGTKCHTSETDAEATNDGQKTRTTRWAQFKNRVSRAFRTAVGCSCVAPAGKATPPAPCEATTIVTAPPHKRRSWPLPPKRFDGSSIADFVRRFEKIAMSTPMTKRSDLTNCLRKLPYGLTEETRSAYLYAKVWAQLGTPQDEKQLWNFPDKAPFDRAMQEKMTNWAVRGIPDAERENAEGVMKTWRWKLARVAPPETFSRNGATAFCSAFEQSPEDTVSDQIAEEEQAEARGLYMRCRAALCVPGGGFEGKRIASFANPESMELIETLSTDWKNGTSRRPVFLQLLLTNSLHTSFTSAFQSYHPGMSGTPSDLDAIDDLKPFIRIWLYGGTHSLPFGKVVQNGLYTLDEKTRILGNLRPKSHTRGDKNHLKSVETLTDSEGEDLSKPTDSGYSSEDGESTYFGAAGGGTAKCDTCHF
eukprot:Polyplicarium_translucidae@DN4741_c0_g1_i1.p1